MVIESLILVLKMLVEEDVVVVVELDKVLNSSKSLKFKLAPTSEAEVWVGLERKGKLVIVEVEVEAACGCSLD